MSERLTHILRSERVARNVQKESAQYRLFQCTQRRERKGLPVFVVGVIKDIENIQDVDMVLVQRTFADNTTFTDTQNLRWEEIE